MTDSANDLIESLELASSALKENLGARQPRIGLVLGSGLNHLADEITDAIYVPFSQIPHMKTSTATGHVGQFVCGTLAGKSVLAMQGRLHGYEGYTSYEVAFPIWLMAKVGVDTLITTNAAGAINESFLVGDFCIMKDHINFTGRNPVATMDASKLSERFFSMTDAYDPQLRALAIEVARSLGVRMQTGVYLGLLGPSFETPAEIEMFRAWGADTVAMSVCEEVIAARHVGMRVLGISLITNMAAGIGAQNGCGGASPSDEEVHAVAHTVEQDFSRLMKGILEGI